MILFPVFVIGLFLGSWGYKKFFIHEDTTGTSKILAQVNSEIPANEGFEGINKTGSDFNLLLLGHGGAGHSGGMLTDSIILVNVNFKDKKISLISVPRDLFISGHKINEEYTMSPGSDGWNRMKYAVASVTGLSVDNYIAVDFGGFIKAVDALGGLEIDIPKPYTDEYYPVRGLENETCGKSAEEIADLHAKYSGFELEKQFKCRYETIHFDIGKTKIDGETALKYVRSRHGDGDFGRSQRQFIVLRSLVGKNITADVIDKLMEIVKTDLSLAQAKQLLNDALAIPDFNIGSIQLTDGNVLVSTRSSYGAYILVPKLGQDDFSQIHELITTGK